MSNRRQAKESAENGREEPGCEASPGKDDLREDRERILPVRQHMNLNRGALIELIEKTQHGMGHPVFFFGLLLSHIVWIILNARVIPGLAPWDPYPFTFLATIASVEAPFITLLVLMRQQRNQRVTQTREEVALQLQLHSEQQLTQTLRILDAVREHMGVTYEHGGKKLQALKRDLDPLCLMHEAEEALAASEGRNPEE